jgi:putative tryptophan/tyrosine transport system substrate-binding protein
LGLIMRRREIITVLGGAMAALTFAARAQQPAKMKRIAIVSPTTKISDISVSGSHPLYRVLFEELGRLGYVEGQNLEVERYSGEGRIERYADLARDVVSAHPDVVVSIGLALYFKPLTTTIPIVTVTADPIVTGLVPSLARPGGNITGVSADAGLEIYSKRLGLLAEATPKLSHVRFLASLTIWEGRVGAAVREAARQASVSLAGAVLRSPMDEAEYQRVFRSMEQDRVDGLMVADEPVQFTHRQLLVELAAKSRIPAIYAFREHVELGGLMAYSIDYDDLFRRMAGQVVDILKGKNPAEIPFLQPTKFTLAVNLKTAKALGFELPPTLVARADEVIE